jgi:hypothetical protein
MRRRLSRPGLSYYEANRGRLVTIEKDVLDIKGEIESRWPNQLLVFWDKEDQIFVIVEHCSDGVDRLVGTYPTLDQRVLDRLIAADNQRADHEDILDQIDKANAAIEAKRDALFSNQLGDAFERLDYALRKDGVVHRPQVSMANK